MALNKNKFIELKDLKVGQFFKYKFKPENNGLRDDVGYYIGYSLILDKNRNTTLKMNSIDIYIFDEVKDKTLQDEIGIPLEESDTNYNSFREIEILCNYDIPEGSMEFNEIREKFFGLFPEYSI